MIECGVFWSEECSGTMPEDSRGFEKGGGGLISLSGTFFNKGGSTEETQRSTGKGGEKGGGRVFRRRGGGYEEEGRICLCHEKIFKSIERVEGKRKPMLEGGGLCLRHKYRCKFTERYQYRLQSA